MVAAGKPWESAVAVLGAAFVAVEVSILPYSAASFPPKYRHCYPVEPLVDKP